MKISPVPASTATTDAPSAVAFHDDGGAFGRILAGLAPSRALPAGYDVLLSAAGWQAGDAAATAGGDFAGLIHAGDHAWLPPRLPAKVTAGQFDRVDMLSRLGFPGAKAPPLRPEITPSLAEAAPGAPNDRLDVIGHLREMEAARRTREAETLPPDLGIALSNPWW